MQAAKRNGRQVRSAAVGKMPRCHGKKQAERHGYKPKTGRQKQAEEQWVGRRQIKAGGVPRARSLWQEKRVKAARIGGPGTCHTGKWSWEKAGSKGSEAGSRNPPLVH